VPLVTRLARLLSAASPISSPCPFIQSQKSCKSPTISFLRAQASARVCRAEFLLRFCHWPTNCSAAARGAVFAGSICSAAARGAVLVGFNCGAAARGAVAALAIFVRRQLLFKLLGGRGTPNTDFFHYEIGSSFFTSKTSRLANDYGEINDCKLFKL
jgi:hypothetical protein